MRTTLSLALLLSFIGLVSAQTFEIINNCPADIYVYNRGRIDENLSPQETYTRTINPGSTTKGYFFTNYNGGNPSGNLTTRFVTYQRDGVSYYYLAKGLPFNTGIKVEPTADDIPEGNYCPAITCDSHDCEEAFPGKTVRSPIETYAEADEPQSDPPTAPLYSCKGDNIKYKITFCPSGAFPNDIKGIPIHTALDDNKCLDVAGGVFENGTPVQIFDCNNTPAQQWVVDRGFTQVRLAQTGPNGKQYCLDRGLDPQNGDSLKIWECFKNHQAQTYQFTENKQLAYAGSCLDLENGNTENGHKIQTWQCEQTAVNKNQLWEPRYNV